MNRAQRRGAGGGKFYQGDGGVEGWWQRREQMLGLFIASENIPVWRRWKTPSFPPWAEIWGWLLNNGPLLAPAGHRTQRLAPSEQKRLCTWMSKCWFDEVSSVSQGVSQVRQNISVCWMTHLCQIVFVFFPLDMPGRWGLPHRTVWVRRFELSH